jgi:hypothetical protein
MYTYKTNSPSSPCSSAVSTLNIGKLGKELIPLDSVSNSPDFEEILYIE